MILTLHTVEELVTGMSFNKDRVSSFSEFESSTNTELLASLAYHWQDNSQLLGKCTFMVLQHLNISPLSECILAIYSVHADNDPSIQLQASPMQGKSDDPK